MGFWDDVMETGQGFMQKAKDTTDMKRLSNMNKSSEKKMDIYFAEIGKRYYQEHELECEQLYPEQVATLRALQENINMNNKLIEEIATSGICPQCGEKVEPDQMFCAKCGAFLGKEESESETL